MFHVETGEVANILKGGNRIQNHLGELGRTRKLCKQNREELRVNIAEKGQVVGIHFVTHSTNTVILQNEEKHREV